tara:strand:+ start:1262 stop:1687 length:426 start_codon:yes stop_codon:yes gene_type:complete
MSDAVEQVFEQLHELDNRAMQGFMREVENELLMVALKDSSPRIMDKFLSNMSKRAGSIFIEEMERMTWVTPDDVQVARQKLIALMVQLVQRGEMSMPPSIVLPDDARVKTMGTRIEDRIEEIDRKLDLLLKSVDDLRRKIQ